LTTVDAKTIIIPNSDAIGGSIVNYSIEDKKRIDLDVGISYSDNIDTARKVLLEVAKKDERVLHEEDVQVLVKSLGDNAVIMCLRVWVASADYWPALFDLTEETKKAFDATGGELNFPFPQRDVHLYNQK
jgi:small conductance mechanosensitive channel